MSRRRGDGRRERRPYVRPRSRPLETSPSRRRWDPTNARSSSRAQPSCEDRRVADATSPPTFRGVGHGRHQGRYGQDACRLPRAYAREPPHVIFFTALMLAPGDEPLISSLDKALFVIEPLLRVQRGSSRLRERALLPPEPLRVVPLSDGTVGKRADRSACASSCTWA
jgi:hypothetical protein